MSHATYLAHDTVLRIGPRYLESTIVVSLADVSAALPSHRPLAIADIEEYAVPLAARHGLDPDKPYVVTVINEGVALQFQQTHGDPASAEEPKVFRVKNLNGMD